MNLMEMQLSWHSVRKKLKIGRPGFVILRCDVYLYENMLISVYSSSVFS
jgi:hypothetical protein